MTAEVIPQPSRSAPPTTGIPIPRSLGWGAAIAILSAGLGAGVWAKTLDQRVAELERAKDKAEVSATEASRSLQRIEKTLCAVCMGLQARRGEDVSNLGQGACRASCGL